MTEFEYPNSTTIAHVTYYAGLDEKREAEGDEPYIVYSATKRGNGIIRREHAYYWTIDGANKRVEELADRLSAIIEKRRSGEPTALQLLFLFQQKIPIPITLTWGEASDLIAPMKAKIEAEKEARRKAKKEAQQQQKEKSRLTYAYNRYRPGEKVTNSVWGEGLVLHVDEPVASIQFKDNRRDIHFAYLAPVLEDDTTLP